MDNYDRHTLITIFTRHLCLDIIVHNTCISQKSLHVTMSFTCYYMFKNHNTLREREREIYIYRNMVQCKINSIY